MQENGFENVIQKVGHFVSVWMCSAKHNYNRRKKLFTLRIPKKHFIPWELWLGSCEYLKNNSLYYDETQYIYLFLWDMGYFLIQLVGIWKDFVQLCFRDTPEVLERWE